MENKKFIFSAAIFFSALFGVIYYLIFTNFVQVQEASNIYMNQVGLYKSSENATSVVSELKKSDIECFTMKKEDLIAVVCSLSDVEEETKQQQEKLSELGYAYILKSIVVENPEIIDLLHEKDYMKALEMINHESQGADAQ